MTGDVKFQLDLKVNTLFPSSFFLSNKPIVYMCKYSLVPLEASFLSLFLDCLGCRQDKSRTLCSYIMENLAHFNMNVQIYDMAL